MFGLQPPRHISTLHLADMPKLPAHLRFRGQSGVRRETGKE
jgi:hypothetical protein